MKRFSILIKEMVKNNKCNQMKKFLNFTLASGLFFITVSCTNQSNQPGLTSETNEIQNRSFPPTSNTTPVRSQPPQVNPDDLAIIKKYAESYEPKPEKNTFTPATPVPSEKVIQVLDSLTNSQSREHEKYIVLIFLRLNRYHIENFHQSYDLGGNALDKEFYRLIGENYDPTDEPNRSSLATSWVIKNPELLKYPLIARK